MPETDLPQEFASFEALEVNNDPCDKATFCAIRHFLRYLADSKKLEDALITVDVAENLHQAFLRGEIEENSNFPVFFRTLLLKKDLQVGASLETVRQPLILMAIRKDPKDDFILIIGEDGITFSSRRLAPFDLPYVTSSFAMPLPGEIRNRGYDFLTDQIPQEVLDKAIKASLNSKIDGISKGNDLNSYSVKPFNSERLLDLRNSSGIDTAAEKLSTIPLFRDHDDTLN